MNQLRFSAVGLAAAWACHAPFAQTTPSTAVEATLPSVNVQATADGDNWQTLRAKESRIRPIGAEVESTTLDTNVAQHASVIDADELNRINALNTLDVLERVPGVTVNRTGGLDGTIVLRGQDSSGYRVPMFIDGDRFRGRPAFQFMMISPAELEQVEVIRGPASVRYGSDGLSGLVNFVTKKPKGTLGEQFTFQGGEADVTYRSNGNALQSNLSVEAAGNQFDLRAYASARNANNFSSPLGTVPNSDYQTASGGLVLGYMPNANERFEFSYRYGQIADGTANAATTDKKYSRRNPLSIHQLRLGYDGQFSDGWVRRLKASVYGNAFDSMLDTHTLSSTTHSVKTSNVRGPNIIGGSLSVELPTLHNVDTQLGIDMAHDRWLGNKEATTTNNLQTGVTTPGNFARTGREMTQSNVGLFALNSWKVSPQWTLTSGARYDYYLTDTEVNYLPHANLRPLFEAGRNTTTGALTGSVGTSYFLTDKVELTGSYGSGFHMPWYSEMFGGGWNADTQKYTIPNPALKPEYSTTAEMGTRLHLDQAYIDVAAYRAMYRGFMESKKATYLTPDDAFQTQNTGKARIEGLDTSAKWQLNDRWNLHGNLAYVRGTNRSNGQPIKGLAPWSGAVGAQYLGAGERWSVTGEVQFAKGQTRYNPDEYPTAGYGVVNVYGQVQLDKFGLGGKNTQLVMGVTNLFDTTYRSASTGSTVGPDTPVSRLNPLISPGRSVNLTLRTKF